MRKISVISACRMLAKIWENLYNKDRYKRKIIKNKTQ